MDPMEPGTHVGAGGRGVGGAMTTSSGQGAGLGVLPSDSAYSSTTVSTGVDPSTGQPTTTYQTYTVGAVPTTEEGLTAGYATYQTYTATTVGVPLEMAEEDIDVDVGDVGGGRVVDISEMDTGVAAPAADIGKGGGMGGDEGGRVSDVGGAGGGMATASGEVEMSGGMGTGGGDDDVGGMAGGATRSTEAGIGGGGGGGM